MDNFRDPKHLDELKFLQIILRNFGSAYKTSNVNSLYALSDGTIESTEEDIKKIRFLDGSMPDVHNISNFFQKMDWSCLELGLSEKYGAGRYRKILLKDSEIADRLNDGWRYKELNIEGLANPKYTNGRFSENAFIRDFLILDFELHGNGEQTIEEVENVSNMINPGIFQYSRSNNILNHLYENGAMGFYGDGYFKGSRDYLSFFKFKAKLREGFDPKKEKAIMNMGYQSKPWDGRIYENHIGQLLEILKKKPNGFTQSFEIEETDVDIDIASLYHNGLIEKTQDYISVARMKTDIGTEEKHNSGIFYRLKEEVMTAMKQGNTLIY